MKNKLRSKSQSHANVNVNNSLTKKYSTNNIMNFFEKIEEENNKENNNEEDFNYNQDKYILNVRKLSNNK